MILTRRRHDKSGNILLRIIPICCLLGIVFIAAQVFAAIPLVTDDTGTQGKGKFQLELFGEYSDDTQNGVKAKSTDLSATLTYGIIDTVDIILSIPYAFWEEREGSFTERENGFSDIAMEVKWRFFEKNGFSLALKPGFTLPAGDEDEGLGSGRGTYYLYFIASREANPWSFHFNLACMRNENKLDERKDIWHASFASTLEVIKKLKLVGDIGLETNPDRTSGIAPAYILGGFIYSPAENFDIGLGVKGGLTEPEADVSVRGGITWRF